jgi:hypothetical protein
MLRGSIVPFGGGLDNDDDGVLIAVKRIGEAWEVAGVPHDELVGNQLLGLKRQLCHCPKVLSFSIE